jgi:hypothetical protein
MLKAIITMMDVPTALSQLAPRMQRLGRGGALLIFSCCLLIISPLCYLWWRFDLSSTWNWFDWLLTDPTRAPAEVTTTLTNAGADDDTTQVMLMLFGSGFTLLPSAVQIGLARFVNVPALGFLVKISLGFDLVTDFGPMWELAANNPWFDTTFRFWPLAGLLRLGATLLGTLLASVVIQSAVMLILAGMGLLVLVILFGPQRPHSSPMHILEG